MQSAYSNVSTSRLPNAAAALARVVIGIADGDALTARCDATEGKVNITVRQAKIKAPKKGQPWGNRSKQHLAGVCFKKQAEVRPQTSDRCLNHVVSEIGAHLAVTSMEPGLRVAGTEEIGLADDAPSWRRTDVLHAHARRLFPNANLGQPSRWMGPRPGTPDSLPVIDALPGQPRIFIAAGHGHLGLTGAPHTGHILARMVSGEPAEIDLAAFAPGRFNG